MNAAAVRAHLRTAAFPLALFAAVRALLAGLTWFAALFATRFGRVGVPEHFLAPWPALALITHGDVEPYVAVARWGYTRPGEVLLLPFLPAVGRVALWLGLPVAPALGAAGLAAQAGAFVALHGVARRLLGAGADRWTVGALAAFPFAFHLADGGPLAWVVLATAGATLAALDGALGVASLIAALGAVIHPAALSVVAALIALRGRSARPAATRWALALAPLAVTALWLVALFATRLPVPTVAGLGAWPATFGLPGAWRWALVASAVPGIAGLALLWARAELRWLALASTVALLAVVGLAGPAAGVRAFPAAWGAFLALGAVASRHDVPAGVAVALAGMHEGLYFFFQAHHVPM